MVTQDDFDTVTQILSVLVTIFTFLLILCLLKFCMESNEEDFLEARDSINRERNITLAERLQPIVPLAEHVVDNVRRFSRRLSTNVLSRINSLVIDEEVDLNRNSRFEQNLPTNRDSIASPRSRVSGNQTTQFGSNVGETSRDNSILRPSLNASGNWNLLINSVNQTRHSKVSLHENFDHDGDENPDNENNSNNIALHLRKSLNYNSNSTKNKDSHKSYPKHKYVRNTTGISINVIGDSEDENNYLKNWDYKDRNRSDLSGRSEISHKSATHSYKSLTNSCSESLSQENSNVESSFEISSNYSINNIMKMQKQGKNRDLNLSNRDDGYRTNPNFQVQHFKDNSNVSVFESNSRTSKNPKE